jgi:uncharacterized protein YyaL (SSP411 family)
MSFTNRLIHEKSPYLLQHAHNPVDWYPWGNEAFELAQKEQKPVFLSIGYATCHWCHVMGSESFENPDLAKLMNDTFINIKVDREELPQVDTIYMEFSQALMSSAGGWPLNVILTPDLKPFFAVTYLPPKTRRGLMGLEEFIQQVKILWNSEERIKLVEQADKLIEIFQQAAIHTTGEELPTESLLSSAIEALFELADPINGGIKGEPKFPLGYHVQFFLNFSRLHDDSRALFYSELTLGMMARGGLYDHLGGGFSRYCVDERWQVPHFEKMLYDNAILAMAYLDAWRFTRKPFYRQIVEETLNYVLRDMSHAEGGFYSAEDADSEGHEGLYYTWTPEEVEETLGKEDALLFSRCYGVTAKGNFEGRSILHLEIPLEELKDEIRFRLTNARTRLLEKRRVRPRPFKDDKILSGWNGLMIDALVRAGTVLDNERYLQAALRAAEFIYTNLWGEGRLLRRFREGESRFPASLDDYASMIKAGITLFEAGLGTKWLGWAVEMSHVLEREFKAEKGAFFQTDGSDKLLVRKCEYYDGAEPSGNAIHCENLLRLYQLSGEEKYLLQAEEILKAAKGHIEAYPPGSCYHLINLQRYLDVKAQTLVIALDEKNSLEKEIKGALLEGFNPHLTLAWKKNADREIEMLLPLTSDKHLIDGQTALYFCRQDHCETPLISREEMIKAIQRI